MSRSTVLLLVAVAIPAMSGCLGGDGADSGEPSVSGTSAASGLEAPPGQIVGYVRDVNRVPVAGARVRLARGGRTVRSARSGRFRVRAAPGRQLVVADHPAYTRQGVETTLRRGRGARVDFSLAVTAPDRVAAANSADRLLFWTSCDEVANLNDAELRRWIDRGVDGFVCQVRHLPGLGSSHAFSASAGTLRGRAYALQRRLRNSAAVRRAREGKLALYLGFWMSNFLNERTPLAEWFDDRAWSREVLPQVRKLAGAARSMGFTGLAIDHELYAQDGGVTTASWSWGYPGNGRTETQVRAQVKERGRELMRSMLSGYPGLELVAYDTQHPENWQAKVQEEVNGLPDVFGPDVRIDLWDGLLSVPGYSAVRWMDAIFYKSPQVHGASWDTALEYNANSVYSYLSRRLSNWSYASSRLHVSPFSWIDEGPEETDFDDARPPEVVEEQLEAFKKWGTGGSFANYAYGPLDGFDYGPYVEALRRASSPERVDRRPPRLTLTRRRLTAGETTALKGVASDDMALRVVRWYDDRGRGGTARMTWRFSGDQRSGWNGEMSWSIAKLHVPSDARRITISAEDIKGLATVRSLPVRRAADSAG